MGDLVLDYYHTYVVSCLQFMSEDVIMSLDSSTYVFHKSSTLAMVPRCIL